MSNEKTGSTRCLDGIRAFAALSVVLGHSAELSARYTRSPFHYSALLTWLGEWAVPVFITLSGFLISYPVAKYGALDGGVLKFYERRCNRILPAYVACVAIGYLIAVLVTHTAAWTDLMIGPFWSTTFLVNDLAPAFGIAMRPDWQVPLWTTPIEFHIYFFAPLLYFGWRRFGLLRSTIGALVFVAVLQLVQTSMRFDWLHAHFYALFVFGSVAAWIVVSPSPTAQMLRTLPWRLVARGAFFILVAFLLADRGTLAALDASPEQLAFGLGAAAAFVSLCLSGSRERAFFDSRIMRWIGERSYSLYLLHWPIISVVAMYLSRHLQQRPLWLATFVVALPLSVLAAHASYTWIEAPYFKARKKSTTAAASRAAAPVVGIGGLSGTVGPC